MIRESLDSYEQDDGMPSVPHVVDAEYLQELKSKTPLLVEVQVALAERYAHEQKLDYNADLLYWWIKTFGEDFRTHIVNEAQNAALIEDYERSKKQNNIKEGTLKKIEETLYQTAESV